MPLSSRSNNVRRGRLPVLAALSACSALAVGSLAFGQLAPDAMAGEAGDLAVPSEVTVEEPLSVEINLVDGVVPGNYTLGGPVDEAVGDEQQQDAVSAAQGEEVGAAHAAESALNGTEDVSVARVDLETDSVLAGVVWDIEAETPEEISVRYLEEGVWSEWVELDSAAEDTETPTSSTPGTEPFAVFNATAIEALAKGTDGLPVPGLRLVIVGSEAESGAENELERAETQGPSGLEQTLTPPATTESFEQSGGAEPADSSSAEKPEKPAASEEETLPDDAAPDISGAEDVAVVENAALSGPPSALGAFLTLPSAINAAGTVYDTGFSGLKINTRTAWRAPTPSDSPDSMTVKGAVIHHTLSTNNYTQAQVAEQIRNINHYHANVLDWGDIGYNLVVDKYGGVWEGRAGGLTKGILGAHATGANWDTFGITVLGGYDESAPPQVALDAVAKAIAWKLSVHGVTDVEGSATIKHDDGKRYSTPVISGHRDVGNTTCPGDAFYAKLTGIRTQVAALIRENSNPLTTVRFGEGDRYATNVAVNSDSSATGKPVFVVTGTDFADALTASPAVSRLGGSLFLTRPTALDKTSLAAIVSKKPSAIYVVGGTGAVSDSVLTQIRSATSVNPVRVSGADRYETASAVLSRFFAGSSVTTAFIATGRDFPDALTAAAAGGSLNAPVLLVNGEAGRLPESASAVLARAGSKLRVVAVGGSGIVTPSTLNDLRTALPRATVTQVGGEDRYATNLAVNQYVSGAISTPLTGIWLATGLDFPDALSAAPSAGTSGQRLVLSRQSCVPKPVVSSWVHGQTSKVSRVNVVGGEAVLSPEVVALKECP